MRKQRDTLLGSISLSWTCGKQRQQQVDDNESSTNT
jgi:hypothetical protein